MKKPRRRANAGSATYWWTGRDQDDCERDGVTHCGNLTLTDWVESQFLEGWQALEVCSGPDDDAEIVAGIRADESHGRVWWARDRMIGMHTIGFDTIELADGDPCPRVNPMPSAR